MFFKCRSQEIDAYKAEEIEEDDLITERTSAHYTLEEWEATWMNKLEDDVLFISATKKENIELFRKKVYEAVREIHIQRYPYNDFLYPEYDQFES